MTPHRLFNNFLDFKEYIRIDYIYEQYQADWYNVSLDVKVKVPRHYILQAILELIMCGHGQNVIMDAFPVTHSQYQKFLWEIKRIVGMEDKTVVYMRKNRKLVEKRFEEYFAGEHERKM